MKLFTYRIIIEPDEGGTYHGYVPALHGCHTWGVSVDEAKKKLKEAMNVYIDDVVADGEKVPQDDSYESFETVIIPDAGGLAYA